MTSVEAANIKFTADNSTSETRYVVRDRDGNLSWRYLPTIPGEYDWMNKIVMAAIIGFAGTNLTRCTSDGQTITVGLKQACVVYSHIYGYCNAMYKITCSGGSWLGDSPFLPSGMLAVIPYASGSMMGSYQGWRFLTTEGLYTYQASSGTPTCSIALQNGSQCACYSVRNLIP
ncbi:MAG: hypothetical protein NC218_01790 [Acetobacter sp.]|nr:hypothetical protein [Acetobacter sp.]